MDDLTQSTRSEILQTIDQFEYVYKKQQQIYMLMS